MFRNLGGIGERRVVNQANANHRLSGRKDLPRVMAFRILEIMHLAAITLLDPLACEVQIFPDCKRSDADHIKANLNGFLFYKEIKRHRLFIIVLLAHESVRFL
ncbi:MAG: hypothetical protein M1423_08590 [Acidobacteria bacterium]|nr:hypothetical protein [Acidobacteriota bacterium]